MKYLLAVLLLVPVSGGGGQTQNSDTAVSEYLNGITEKLAELKHKVVLDNVTDTILKYKQELIDSVVDNKITPSKLKRQQ